MAIGVLFNLAMTWMLEV